MTDKTLHTSIERIGIDESGKGDYFGPLVIAAVFVDATTQSELTLMQVRDSRKYQTDVFSIWRLISGQFVLIALLQSGHNDTTNSMQRSET